MVLMCDAQHVDFDQMHLYVSYFPFVFIRGGGVLGKGLGSSHVFSVQSDKQ